VPEGVRELRIVLTSPDHDAVLRFYRDVLGLRVVASFVDDNGGRATLLHAGRATVELGDELHAAAIDGIEVGRRVAGRVRLAFEVEDAAEAAERLVTAGGTPVAAPVRTPWGSLNARLDDPDGQQLTVYSVDRYLLDRPRLDGPVLLAEPDESWPETAAALVRDIRGALGPAAIVVEHAGSTSVRGLPAKPILDLVLGVPDPRDEDSYLPALEGLGYRLHLREPEWHEHRLLKHDDPEVNLHVFAAGAEEIDRMLAFRDHLRRDSADRELYLRTKRELAARSWARVQDYADAKSDVVADIMRRALAAGPSPLRGCVVLVTDPGAGDEARALAAELAAPLLSERTVAAVLPPTPETAIVDVLLALVADSGGAVLHAPSLAARPDAVARLPGRVVELSLDGARSTAELARRVRQAAR
jgi:GrpB-like predicted nucleotidyltransferase (UPF0157 family)/predicted enzyme related to lactoylglutathione lyase